MKLFEIADEYQEILSGLYNVETGEVNEASLAKLQELQDSLESKCIAVASYIENMEAERKAIEQAKKNMAEREARYKKQVLSMKEYLLINMEKSQLKKVSCPQFEITLRKNPPAVDIFDEDAIPHEYDKVIIEHDTAKIRDHLMHGVVIPGARLVQRNSVRIK